MAWTGGTSTAATFNAYSYVTRYTTSATSINTNTTTGSGGNISVANGDIIVSACQYAIASDTSCVATTTASGTLTAITPDNSLTTSQEASYGVTTSANSAFNVTSTFSTSLANASSLALDFTCATCGTAVTATGHTSSSASSLTISSLNCTAGSHGCMVVMCGSTGVSNTWSAGTISGTAATLIASDTSSKTTGYQACEWALVSGSISSGSASINVGTSTNISAAVIMWPY